MSRFLLILAAAALAATAARAAAPIFAPVPADGLPRTGKTFGATWADLDGDGRLDLLLSLHGRGAGVFLAGPGLSFHARRGPIALPSGPPDNHGGAACDFDADGDWDVLITAGTDLGHDEGCNALLVQEAPGIFTEGLDCDDPIADAGGRGRGAVWLALDGDRFPELLCLNYITPPRLFRFDGTGWTDWSRRIVLDRTHTLARTTWYNTAAACDLDGDGRTDLYAAAGDRVLWHNAGDGRLEDVTAAAGLRRAGPALVAAACGDVDGDGDPDLLTAVRAPAHVTLWRNIGRPGRPRFERGADLPRLSPNAEIDSIVLEDLDNDGRLDLYLALLDHTANLPNAVWQGLGDGTFADVDGAWGATAEVPALPAGAWAVDLDRDGDLDLAVIHGRENWPDREGAVVLLENSTSRRGITLQLESTDSPPHGLGAVVTLRLPDRDVVRQVQPSLSFWNSTVLPIHFGVGDTAGPYPVEIRWPAGRVQSLTLPDAGRAYLVREDADAADLLSGS